MIRILSDIFKHCMDQSAKLSEIAGSKYLRDKAEAKAFSENIRIHLHDVLIS